MNRTGFLNPSVAKVVGAMLMAVSMVFTVQLLTSFAQEGDIFNKLVFVTFGVAVQTAQTLLFIYYCLDRKPFHAALWAFLFVLSLCGSLGYFAVGDSTQKQLSIQSDARYGLLKERKDALQKEIDKTNRTIAAFSKGKYFSNGVRPTQELLKDLRHQQADVHRQLMTFTADPPQESLYVFLAMLSGLTIKQTKLVLFGAYAVALDLVSVALLGIFIQVQVKGGYRPVPFQNGDSDRQIGIAENDSSGAVQVRGTGTGYREPDTGLMTRYIDALYPVKSDGSLTGRRRICDLTGISNKESDACHRQLKKLGIVEVRGSKTFPCADKDAALAAVS